MKKLNLNDHIKFKLNDRGKDIYYHRFDKLNKRAGKIVCEPRFPEVDENGFTEFQLWHFIEIYGQHIGFGRPEFWDNDFNFYIKDEDIDDVEFLKEG